MCESQGNFIFSSDEKTHIKRKKSSNSSHAKLPYWSSIPPYETFSNNCSRTKLLQQKLALPLIWHHNYSILRKLNILQTWQYVDLMAHHPSKTFSSWLIYVSWCMYLCIYWQVTRISKRDGLANIKTYRTTIVIFMKIDQFRLSKDLKRPVGKVQTV